VRDSGTARCFRKGQIGACRTEPGGHCRRDKSTKHRVLACFGIPFGWLIGMTKHRVLACFGIPFGWLIGYEVRMLKTFKSLPEDPIELRVVSALMAAGIKSQACQIEKLKKELAVHRKARFGARSESLDQLALDLQENTEIEVAAKAQRTAPKGDAEEAAPPKRTAQTHPQSRRPNAPTIAPRYLSTPNARKRSSRPVMPAAIAAVRSSSSAKMASPCPPLVRGQ